MNWGGGGIKCTGKSWSKLQKVIQDMITKKVGSHKSPKEKMEFLAGLANFIHDKPPPMDGSIKTKHSAANELSKPLYQTGPLENNACSADAQEIESSSSCQVHDSTSGLVG